MNGQLLEFGIVGGVALAAVVKAVLRFAWQRVTAPRGRHRRRLFRLWPARLLGGVRPGRQ